MNPEYEFINADILDAADSLGEFDIILTDPPYSTRGTMSMTSKESVLQAREMTDVMSQSLILGALKLIKKKTANAIFLMTDWRQVSLFSYSLMNIGYLSQSCIVWNKMSGAVGSLWQPSYEMILFGYCGDKNKLFAGCLGKDLIDIKRLTKKTHAFEKPPQLAEKLLKGFNKGLRVIDPFCGTGGLLLGAYNMGFNVVGVDIIKRNVDVAKERFEEQLV